jgi:hypothetical protein
MQSFLIKAQHPSKHQISAPETEAQKCISYRLNDFLLGKKVEFTGGSEKG